MDPTETSADPPGVPISAVLVSALVYVGWMFLFPPPPAPEVPPTTAMEETIGAADTLDGPAGSEPYEARPQRDEPDAAPESQRPDASA